MAERKEILMTSNRKVLTGLAVLIVLSLLVMPATAFAQQTAEGAARVHRVIKPWKVKRMQFTVAEENGIYPPYGSMYVHDAECDNLLWSIPRVKCVSIPDENGIAFFAGKGAGKKAGKFVLVVAKEGSQAIEVRTTRSKRYFRYWCKHPSVHGLRSRWDVDKGYVSVD
jgi:hypothetical protein